jgi:hypothetical protein
VDRTRLTAPELVQNLKEKSKDSPTWKASSINGVLRLLQNEDMVRSFIDMGSGIYTDDIE